MILKFYSVKFRAHCDPLGKCLLLILKTCLHNFTPLNLEPSNNLFKKE
jgi:hypothetical protein